MGYPSQTKEIVFKGLEKCSAPRIFDQILPLAEGKGVCCMVASHNADPHSTSLRSVFLVQYDGIGMLFLSLFFSY